MAGDEVDVRLGKLRKAMVRMRRAGRQAEFAALADAYATLKREQMEAAEREHIERARARRAVREAVRPVERPGRWRLPRGFGVSPLAAERAREGRSEGGPQVPYGGHLSPWMTGRWSPMQTRIWRP
ncbi:hypothetical protein [Streptomyces regalis]|uniref:hypothetical protein n=1 Tax=Streptomyces regalis TaxID=68262 RepID=UPI000AA5413B|nr:hypothetical protein [Streptomyces regalis]